MLINEELAEKVRSKRGKLDFTKTRTASVLNVTRGTLAKIEQGNYDAPKRIYQSVMEWLVEDCQKGANMELVYIDEKKER